MNLHKENIVHLEINRKKLSFLAEKKNNLDGLVGLRSTGMIFEKVKLYFFKCQFGDWSLMLRRIFVTGGTLPVVVIDLKMSEESIKTYWRNIYYQ